MGSPSMLPSRKWFLKTQHIVHEHIADETEGPHLCREFLPEEVGASTDRSALVRLLQQLRAVPCRLVHQRVSALGREHAAAVQYPHNALQCRDLCLAVWNGLLVQDESLHPAGCSQHV